MIDLADKFYRKYGHYRHHSRSMSYA